MERPVSGKSLQTMKRTLVQELKLDKDVEKIFEKLIGPSDEDVDGLELDKKTSDGDTILHRLVRASVDSPGNMKYYMMIVDKIHSRSGQWWKTNGKDENKGDKAEKEYTYLGMTHLLEKCKEKQERNVWDLSIQLVAIDMIEKLMYLKDVTYKEEVNGNMVFDMSMFIEMQISEDSLLSRSCKCFCTMNKFDVKLQPLLQRTKAKNKMEELLRVKPIREITDIFCSISTKVYIMVVFLHIVYMSLFSYLGCELMDARNKSPSDTTKGLIYSFGIAEPILLTLYLFNQPFKLCKSFGEKSCGSFWEPKKINYFLEAIWFVTILVYNVLLCKVIASVGNEITSEKRNTLSACLLLGWLLTFALADGIRQIHFFFKLVIRVMIRDVLRILVVYIIFLLGFSLSIHAQFISSANITMTYDTPVHTMFLMFNVMVGMEEAVDEETEIYLEEVHVRPLVSKLIYIGYVLCSTIVLLNLLIAMMNTSYSTIEIEHLNEWVFNAAHFGAKFVQYFSTSGNILGASKIKKVKIFEHLKESVWTIEVCDTDLISDGYQSKSMKYTDKELRTLGYEIEHSEKILKEQIFDMKRSQGEIMNCIENIQARIEKLSQYISQTRSDERSLGEQTK